METNENDKNYKNKNEKVSGMRRLPSWSQPDVALTPHRDD